MNSVELDILIPLHTPNLDLLDRCLSGVDRNPPGCIYRVLLALDGLSKSDRARITAQMQQRKPQRTPNPIGQPGAHQMAMAPPKDVPDWMPIDWPGVVYWRESVMNAIDRLTGRWLLILPPWIELDHKRWFGLLQQPFMQAPHTALVCPLGPKHEANTGPPALLNRRVVPEAEFGLMRRESAKEALPALEFASPLSMIQAYSRFAEKRSGGRWIAPAVRYTTIEHHPHEEPCREPSPPTVPAPKSASRSLMTPDSSSPTTTGKGGLEDSIPF